MIKYIHDTSRVRMFGFHQEPSILYPDLSTAIYHTTCCLPLDWQKKKVWVFPYQFSTNTNDFSARPILLFGQTTWRRAWHVLISPTSYFHLPCPTPLLGVCRRDWECVLDFDNEGQVPGNLRRVKGVPLGNRCSSDKILYLGRRTRDWRGAVSLEEPQEEGFGCADRGGRWRWPLAVEGCSGGISWDTWLDCTASYFMLISLVLFRSL